MKKIRFIIGLVLAITLTSCASNKVADSANQIYTDETAVIKAGKIQNIPIGKVKKDALKTDSIHVEDSSVAKAVPVSVYQLSLQENTKYNFTLKSHPNGLVAMDANKKSIMIPTVLLYDEDFNIIPNQNLTRKTVAPTNTENLLFRVTADWDIKKTGTYYLVIKSDMSSEQGITLTVWSYGGSFNGSLDIYFKRNPYGRYSLKIE